MFSKDSKLKPDLTGKTNRIVEGTKIKGDIFSQADFRLDGELLGNFHSTAKIVIGQAGKIIGEVSCKNADIEGRFEGKIIVSETLSVKSKAIINGEVTVGRLSIEPGAEFSATCSMKQNVKSLNATNNGKEAEGKTA